MIIGYYTTFFSILFEIQEELDTKIEINLGAGFYFMIITTILIVVEIYYLKNDGFQIKLFSSKKEDIKEETI